MKITIILITLILISIGLSSYLVYLVFLAPEQNLEYTSIKPPHTVESSDTPLAGEADFPEGLMVYENIRFSNKTISYSIDSNCDEKALQSARGGFSILQQQTILTFYEVSSMGKIEVHCSKEEIYNSENKEYFIAGEGGPLTIINSTVYYIIENGTVLLYGENKCDKPNVAIHEILHVLGFKHSSNKNSIMYNLSYCNQEIDPIIIKKINSLYQTEPLSDLEITRVNATKKGSYLNFELEISNIGLIDSPIDKLEIYANGKKISEYTLSPIKIGEGIILNTENLKIPISTKNISFIIDPENLNKELNEQNNAVTLSLQ